MTDGLTDQRVRLELEGGWRYRGRITADDGTFLTIFDEVAHHRVMIRRDQIVRMEVLS